MGIYLATSTILLDSIASPSRRLQVSVILRSDVWTGQRLITKPTYAANCESDSSSPASASRAANEPFTSAISYGMEDGDGVGVRVGERDVPGAKVLSCDCVWEAAVRVDVSDCDGDIALEIDWVWLPVLIWLGDVLGDCAREGVSVVVKLTEPDAVA